MRCVLRLPEAVAIGVAFGAALYAYAAEPIAVVETHAFAPLQRSPGRAASHALALDLVTFAGSRWRTDEIVGAAERAAQLLATCGVAMDSAELRVLEAPLPFRYYSTPVSRELLKSVVVRKPAVFFVEDTRNRPAYDAEAIGLSNSASRRELANTVWIAYGSRDLPEVLAHELVHVLSDSGDHNDLPGNLMRNETAPEATQLTAKQCERVRRVGEANGLLKRR